MERFDDLTRRISRALKTPGQVRADERAQWERRQARLPEYCARDLLYDSRGLFTPADELSRMDAFLARHGRLVTDWQRKSPKLVIDLRAARRELEQQIRTEGLSFLERALLRRNFRATVSLLQTQGARRSYIGGTLTLNWRQKALYRFGELKPGTRPGTGFKANGRTEAIYQEAKRQSGREGESLRYDPRRDPRVGVYPELKRLQQAGLARPEPPGVWKLDRGLIEKKVREAGNSRALLSVSTLKRLRETRWQQSKDSGLKTVSAPDTQTRQAVAELESCYPQAARTTREGHQVSAPQLRKALYADRTRFVEVWAKAHHAPQVIARCDHRLGEALAASTIPAHPDQGNLAVYHPEHDDTTGKAAEISRYLRGLAMRRDQKAVRFGQGGSFLIDRQEAVTLLKGHRAALLAYESRLGEAAKGVSPRIVSAFTHAGSPQPDGSWLFVPKAGESALLWRLHQEAALNPAAIGQEPDGSYRLSPETARAHALPGTPEWGERMTKRHAGLDTRVAGIPRPDFLSVTLKDERAPLSGKLAATTQATYERVARRQRLIPLEERPRYLIKRAQELSRCAWWLEHGVMRRELRALELGAGQNEAIRQACYELRTGIEAMAYQALRGGEGPRPIQAARKPVSPQALRELKAVIRARGDQELLDALVISEATGLRPGELARGVRLEERGRSVYVHIQGGKRHQGTAEAQARYQQARGADRVVEVKSQEVLEIARRHHGHFRPESSPDALRIRLREARAEVPGGEHIQFYSFRHAIKNRLETEGHSREEIARLMGHLSTRSQEHYWADLE